MSRRHLRWFTLALATVVLSTRADAQETGSPSSTSEATAAPSPENATSTASAPAGPTPGDDIAPATVAANAELAPTPAVSEAPIELSVSELAELGLGTSSPVAAPLDTSIKFWGFADFSFRTLAGVQSESWKALLGRYSTFFVGNFNLYLSNNITERIRTMAEVRFTYLPNGVANNQTGALTSTTFVDYATYNTTTRWGGIMPQRVYVEATLHRYATLRMGQFLTPYGIWNIDHGSPTIIPVQRPPILNQNLFPESQTGLELFGRWRATADNVLGYHLTVSNGLGPVSEYRDLDQNKAFGGRAFWQFEKVGQLQLGGSFFYGTDTNAIEVPGVSPDGKSFAYARKVERQSRVLSLAGDLRWVVKGFLLQSEFILQQRNYTEDGRRGAVSPLHGHWVAPPDTVSWGVYGLTGYRFDWLGVMPYFTPSFFKYRDQSIFAELQALGFTGGVNIRPVDSFVVKVEFAHRRFLNKSFFGTEPINFVQAQVAWAF